MRLTSAARSQVAMRGRLLSVYQSIFKEKWSVNTSIVVAGGSLMVAVPIYNFFIKPYRVRYKNAKIETMMNTLYEKEHQGEKGN